MAFEELSVVNELLYRREPERLIEEDDAKTIAQLAFNVTGMLNERVKEVIEKQRKEGDI